MARTGFDFDGDGHAGREGYHPVVNLHLRLVEGDTGHVDKLLAFGFAGFGFRACLLFALIVALGLVFYNGVLRHVEDFAVQESIAGEVEGIDLDSGVLVGANKADVFVGYHSLDF